MNDIEKAIEQLKHDKENFEALLKEYKPSTIKERVESIIKSHILAIQALEKQIELNDYLNTLRKNKKYQIYDILSEFALEAEK